MIPIAGFLPSLDPGDTLASPPRITVVDRRHDPGTLVPRSVVAALEEPVTLAV
jgi:hypothetical protein